MTSLERLALSALALELLLIAVAVTGAARSSGRVGVRLGLLPSGLGALAWCVVVAGTVGLSHAVDTGISMLGLRDQSVLGLLDRELSAASGREIAVALVCLGLVPGFAEELLCRGYVQRGLASRIGGAGAVGLGALAFGLLHGEWVQGAAAFLLGLYLGWVVQRTGSTVPAIVCHCANNLVAVTVGVAAAPLDASVGSALLGLLVASGSVAVLRTPGPAAP